MATRSDKLAAMFLDGVLATLLAVSLRCIVNTPWRALHDDLVEVMEKLVTQRGNSAHICSDNGSDFVAHTLQSWLAERQMKTLSIEPASPWQNGHVESFHDPLRDECLGRELMLSVAEVRVAIEDDRRYDNEVRPHGGLGYRTPKQAFTEAQNLDNKVANTVPAA